MSEFTEELKKLNKAQRQAVETIEGPVLVVAGPGTGKTQLLAMRAAHIVRATDTAPSNILCLTFTDSAAISMRKRLIELMGPEGGQVVVHTFHSFGAEIIHNFPEYFYNGARFEPSDELSSYELLQEVFSQLPHNNPLAKTMNDEFVLLPDATRAISHLKRAGLTPSELKAILAHNQVFYDYATKPAAQAFAVSRLSKKDIPNISSLLHTLEEFRPSPLHLPPCISLATLCVSELSTALEEAETTGKTTAITAWRNRWLTKDHTGEFIFKDAARHKKLLALAHIYETYCAKLSEAELFDFDDMVSNVAHTLASTPELRFNLQEQYLYIMVDEFQDTNGAQLRMLSALTDNPVYEGRPNVLAVGDDDQAIYAFQGAELSNILDFAQLYRDPTIITLTENYRSTAPILQAARSIITQAEDRLETRLGQVSKQLKANSQLTALAPQLHEFERPDDEYQWIVADIHKRLKNGTSASDIAILARNHRQLLAILPHLHAAELPVQYERRSNVLESPHISELITLAEAVVAIAEQRYDVAESLLPQLLSFDFWGLKVIDIWQLSLNAYKQHRMWLELMLEREDGLRAIAEFLVVAAHRSLHEPADIMLDMLIGTSEQQAPADTTDDSLADTPAGPHEEFTSPYRAHYFNQQGLQNNAGTYVALLSQLRTLRDALHNWRPHETPSLRDFVDFVDLHMHINLPIVDTGHHLADTAGVNFMTAHKAKGQEFNTVYIVSCQDTIWGRRARTPHSALPLPLNMPIEPAGQRYDDMLRLFFVAATRAKQHLIYTAHRFDQAAKEQLRADFLQSLAATTHEPITTQDVERSLPGWHTRHLALPKATQAAVLKPALERYALSATHLNNFIDVTRGGPQAFLLQNLLRFPQAMTSGQVFGRAIHAVLQRAHVHVRATGERRPLEDILHDYELQLQQHHIGEQEFSYLLEKGSDVLQGYLAMRYDSFSPLQRAEYNFAGQGITLGEARLTGAIDLMDINDANKTIILTDYKTGRSLPSWRATADYDKIKLHKYKQQLLFYKLLVEGSRDYRGYTATEGVLEFIEPSDDNTVHRLTLDLTQEDLTQFKALLQAVWRKIQALELPATDHYEPSYKGLVKFEEDLLK